RRQRGVDEARGDEVDANRRDLKRQGGGERGQRGGGGRGDPEAVTDAPAAGPAYVQYRAPGPHLADGTARDLEGHHDVASERLAHLGRVHLEQRAVPGSAGRNHDVVDRRRQVLEEP